MVKSEQIKVALRPLFVNIHFSVYKMLNRKKWVTKHDLTCQCHSSFSITAWHRIPQFYPFLILVCFGCFIWPLQSSCKPKFLQTKKTHKGFLSLYLQLSDKSTKYDFVNSPVPQDNKNYIQGSLKMRKTYIIWYENIKSDCLHFCFLRLVQNNTSNTLFTAQKGSTDWLLITLHLGREYMTALMDRQLIKHILLLSAGRNAYGCLYSSEFQMYNLECWLNTFIQCREELGITYLFFYLQYSE